MVFGIFQVLDYVNQKAREYELTQEAKSWERKVQSACIKYLSLFVFHFTSSVTVYYFSCFQLEIAEMGAKRARLIIKKINTAH